MRYVTLNHITRSWLSQKRKPIHYYGQAVKYANDCVRELMFDTLQIINTVRLPLNSFFEAEIPSYAVDICKVGIQAGQFIRPLVERDTINRIANIDSTTGDQISYPVPTDGDVFLGVGQWLGVNINSNGENTGGYYGLGAGSEPDTYKVIWERNVIQVNQDVGVNKIVLECIGDGTYTNAATQIEAYAQKTVETYIDWQYKEYSKSYGAYDCERAKQLFYRELEILRARKNNLTPELIERIINRHRKASIQ